MRSWLINSIVGLFACALLFKASDDLFQESACDTTYIWEGYDSQEVPSEVGSRRGYRFIKYVDDPTQRHRGWKSASPSGAHAAVFIHGHLGSYKQMRCLASETGREFVRRWDLAEAGSHEVRPSHLQWWAPDFRAEPTALDPDLLVYQAQYVRDCVLFIQKELGSNKERSRDRVVLVGYSMGGLTAQMALGLMHDHQLPSVLAFIRLADPGPMLYPSLLPVEEETARLLKKGSLVAESLAGVSISAGVGDGLLPDTLDHGIHESLWCQPRIRMEHMPGVWTPGNHKLVRALSPLLMDVTLNCNTKECAQRLLNSRLLSLPGLQNINNTDCKLNNGCSTSGEWQTPPGRNAMQNSWKEGWKLEPTNGTDTIYLVVVGRKPGQEWTATIETSENETIHGLERNAWPLPPALTDSLYHPRCSGNCHIHRIRKNGESVNWATTNAQWVLLPCSHCDSVFLNCSRPWQEIMAGVDWLQNATWLLQVHRKPGQKLGVIPKPDLGLHIYWQASKSASVRQDATAEHFLRVGAPPKRLDPSHSLILGYTLPQPRYPALCFVLFGSKDARPWRASISGLRNQEHGDVDASRRCRWLAQLILNPDGRQGAAVGVPSRRWGSTTSLKLWSVRPSLAYAKGSLIVLSDPHCAQELRLDWDVAAWMAARFRARAPSLPALCLGLCLIESGLGKRIGPLVIVCLALTGVVPSSGGLLETGCLCAVAHAFFNALVMSVCMLRCRRQCKASQRSSASVDSYCRAGLALFCALCSLGIHRSLGPVLSCLWQGWGSLRGSKGAHDPSDSIWAVRVLLQTLVPALQLSTWLLGSNWLPTRCTKLSVALAIVSVNTCLMGREHAQYSRPMAKLRLATGMAIALLALVKLQSGWVWLLTGLSIGEIVVFLAEKPAALLNVDVHRPRHSNHISSHAPEHLD